MTVHTLHPDIQDITQHVELVVDIAATMLAMLCSEGLTEQQALEVAHQILDDLAQHL